MFLPFTGYLVTFLLID